MRRMNSFGRHGLVAALEDEELIDTPVVSEDGDGGAGAETVETELLDVNQDEAEAGEAQDQVDEAVDTAEALESIAVAMESAAGNGGLTKDAAHVVSLALEHMYSQVGISKSKMPALESFGGASSRVGATQLALEDIREQIARIWEAIKAAVLKSVAWLKDRFAKIFGAANKLEKRAKAIAARAESTTGTAKEKTFDSDRLYKALHIGGGVPKMVAAATEINKMAEVVLNHDHDGQQHLAEAFENGELSNILQRFSDANKKLVAGGSEVTNPEAEGFQKDDGVALYRSKELPGGQAIITRVNNGKAGADIVAAANILTKLTSTVGAFNPKAKAPTKVALPVLQPTEGGQICESVAEMAIEVQRYKAGLEKVTKIKDRITKAMDKLGKEAGKEDTDEAKAKSKALQKVGAAVPRLMDQPAASFSAYALNTGKAMLDYVELSLKQYSDK